MLAVAAGVFCFLCGFSYDKKIPKNVTVNGMSVGGLSIAASPLNIARATTDGAATQRRL